MTVETKTELPAWRAIRRTIFRQRVYDDGAVVIVSLLPVNAPPAISAVQRPRDQ